MVKPPGDVGPKNGAVRVELKYCDVDGGKTKPLLSNCISNNHEQLFNVAVGSSRLSENTPLRPLYGARILNYTINYFYAILND
jgi:hypothetical protein